MSLLSQQIFKVNKLVGKNKIGQIYVFFGNNLDIGEQDPNELFQQEKNKPIDTLNPVFLDIFNQDELTNINTNNIPVIFVKQSIHIDDTIGAIKLKIFEAIGKTVSIEEIYMFCLKSEKINPITMYQNLTQNDKQPLTKIRLEHMLTNIYDKTTGVPMDFTTVLEDKQEYTFDDILKLNLTERDYWVASCLGQKFVFANEYSFIVDPFYVSNYDKLLENSKKELTTLNNNLLLESGTNTIMNFNKLFFGNNIFLCLAQDILQEQHKENIQILPEYIFKIYYPFLYKANINTENELDAAKEKLLQDSNAKLSSNVIRTFANINMFYDIFKFPSKESEPERQIFSLNQANTGINSIKIVIYPDFKIKIPVEILFKLLHATYDFPLIKFNPETRQSNMYRLYTDKLSIDGRKIPHLNKSIIFKLIKMIGKTRSVAIYTSVLYQEQTYDMVCEFEENGNISVYSLNDFNIPVLIQDKIGQDKLESRFSNMDAIIDAVVNPLLEEIRPFFKSSGLELPSFKSILSPNIEIRELTYQTVYSITRPIDLNNYMGCLSSVFTVESTNLVENINMKDGASMRFKRVSNFTLLDSQVAFIVEKISQGIRQQEIIKELIQNYDDMNEETANDVLIKTIKDLELIRGANKRRSIMIKMNPGFKTNMILNPIKSELKVVVRGINNIFYLDTIPVYIDSFVRITQDINSTKVDSTEINTLCSGEVIEELDINPSPDEIIAQSEENIKENEVPIIEDDKPIYYSESTGSSPDNDDLLDIIGFAEGSDIEDEDALIGGAVMSNEQEQGQGQDIFTDVGMGPKAKLQAQVAPGPQNIVQDITGMKLKYPNPFSKRIEERMPNLFVKSKDDKIDLYTRMCPFNLAARRQPIILTPDEKKELVDEHPDLYIDPQTGKEKESEFIEYGSDPSKKYYFTCPRFWCLKTNSAVSEADIKAGKCGPAVENIEDAIIPKKADVVPKDRYVYRFYEDGEENFPGFHKEKMPDGSCIPCCYSKWKTTEMKSRRDICQGNFKKGEKASVSMSKPSEKNKVQLEEVVEGQEEQVEGQEEQVVEGQEGQEGQVEGQKQPGQIILEEEAPSPAEEELKRNVQDAENYVKGPEKYPLGEYRWGFLPIGVQKFLHEVNSECQVSKTNMAIKPNHTCLLRYGVENDKNQSFIACIASVFYYDQQREELEVSTDIKPKVKGRKSKKGVLPTKVKPMVPSIKQMKDIIINAIDIDKFITYQNGDLVTSFANPTLDTEKQVNSNNIRFRKIRGQKLVEVNPSTKYKIGDKIECNYHGLSKWYPGTIFQINRNGTYDIAYDKIKVNLDNYASSNLYKKISQNVPSKIIINNAAESEHLEPDEMDTVVPNKAKVTDPQHSTWEFLERVAEAYENFKMFLSDPTIMIDYTYLWDIITTKNPLLFPNGVNLIILEMPEDDSSNNIDLVCPTNHYSSNAYDERKSSIFLIKRENWFEPIFSYRNNNGEQKISSTFVESDKNLKDVFTKIIRPTLGEKCNAIFNNRNREYRFEQPPILENLINNLTREKNYDVQKQVLNFQGKVIGLLVTSPDNLDGFIPCYPSSLSSNYDYVYMSDDIWQPYDKTLDFLRSYYNSGEQEPDKFFHVTDAEFEDVMVVGFLTNTNQFIQINEPVPVSRINQDGILTITGNDTLISDIRTLTTTKVDNRRVDYIKRINLETNFYNTFRNTIRILFNNYSNSGKRKTIKDASNEKGILYKEKLKRVTDLLLDLVDDNIEFVEDFDYKNIIEDDIQTCINNSKDTCDVNPTSICKVSEKAGKCVIQFPALNLVSKQPNKIYYFGRMADELIRYNRIKSFIFKPQSYLSFGQVKYNLRDNEIIVLQDMLNQEFFENLIPSDINKYAKYNTADNAEPITNQVYNNIYEYDIAVNTTKVIDCRRSEPKPISGLAYWKKCFPSRFREVEYLSSPFCPLYLVIDLVKEFYNQDITIGQVKDDLIQEYNKITDNFTNIERYQKILAILRDEEYQTELTNDNIIKGMTIEQMIILEGFNAGNFDLWVLLNRYKIPSMMISKKEFEYRNKTVMVCWTPEEGQAREYAIIMVPVFYKKKKGDDNKENTKDGFNQYKLIKDGNGRSRINISELPESDNQCVSYMEKAIAEYYGIEYYLDNIFDKVPKITAKVLDRFVRNERKQKRQENIELVEEDIVIREVPKIVEEVYKKVNEEAVEEKEEVVEEVAIKNKKPRATRKNNGDENVAKTTRKKKPSAVLVENE